MRIEINECAAKQEQSWAWLTVIVQKHILTEHHKWEVNQWNSLKSSAWLLDENGGTFVRRELTEYIKKVKASNERNGEDLDAPPPPPIAHHNLTIVVDEEDTHPCEVDETKYILSPKGADNCLSAPLMIFVENAKSDGEFWVTIWTAADRKRLMRSFTEGIIEFVSCGGAGEIKKQFERWNKRRAPGPLRALVLRDSDKLWETHMADDPTKDLEAILPAKTHRHVLQSREIENYLPLAALKTKEDGLNERDIHIRSQLQAQRDALEKLPRNARAHYDMKKGFNSVSKMKEQERKNHLKLFESLSFKVVYTLWEGFGEDIGSLFENARDHITREALEEVCEFEEFEVIMDAIEALL
jgi:hypothetical protein